MVVEFTRTLIKWGNSQGTVIPKPILRAMKLKLGDKLNLYMDDSRLIIEKKMK